MPRLHLSDFQYDLPPEKIPLYPLSERDQSKLLVYQNGRITHSGFRDVAAFLPERSILFMNNTRVIPARLLFQKESGATIEIFLLSPVTPSPLLQEAVTAKNTVTWQCAIGNKKRWSKETVLVKKTPVGDLAASLSDSVNDIVTFDWPGDQSFAEVLSATGQTPLPPYLKREADESDKLSYQTIYSKFEGAVAAPTAGLHFTPFVFDKLRQKNIDHDFLTLHVSAGTFQPIKHDDPAEHVMHGEQVIVSRTNLENLISKTRKIIAVGTTSLRTLESIYWYGVRLQEGPAAFTLTQNDIYANDNGLSLQQAVSNVLKEMDRIQTDELAGNTSIYIRPGYRFRVCDGLITNFHQPASTLILLVAAFVGEDWRRIYNEALRNDYRFLSYGDSSLLLP
jgi:S-adenosylmethionine:tRNA ribosyltransferase-isomerase